MAEHRTRTPRTIDHDHKPHGGGAGWLTTTNHKDIGTMYLVFSCTMFFIGGSFAMVIRAELFKPGHAVRRSGSCSTP